MLVNKYSVDEKLIRGSRPRTYCDVKQLKKEGVTQIVCLGTKPYLLERLACKLLGINFVRHNVDLLGGKYPTMDDFQKVTNEIRNNKGKTYIHCSMGLHRTAQCVAAYNVLEKGKSLSKAIKEDLIEKDYFEKKYAPANNVIKEGDGIVTRLIKKRQTKIGQVVVDSFNNFIKIIKK